MKKNFKVVGAILGIALIFLPLLFVKADSAVSNPVPSFGDVPRDELLVSDIIPDTAPIILKDTIIYEKISGGNPAIFKKNPKTGTETKIVDNAKHPSVCYSDNIFNPSGVDVSSAYLFYSKYTDSANGYDIYDYDLRNSTEHLLLSKAGNQDYPRGIINGGAGSSAVYLDITGSDTANLRLVVKTYDVDPLDQAYVSGVTPTTKFALFNGVQQVYYEKGSDLWLYNSSGSTNALSIANASKPILQQNTFMTYEKNESGNINVYMKNLSLNREYSVATSSAEETTPFYSSNGDLSYVVKNDSGSKVVTNKYYYGQDNSLILYSATDVSENNLRQNKNQSSYYGYFIWTANNNVYGFDTGLLNRFNIQKKGDYTFWCDGFNWDGMRLNYYSDSTKTKKVVTIPSNLKMGYNYSTDGSNLILELKPAYTDSSYWWKNRLYAYNLNNGNLTAITEANDNYSYATMKISDGKLLYYFSDHSGGPGTETSKYYLYDFGSAQATEVPVDATANSIWDFNNGYLALSSFHGESQADIKLFNVNTSGTTTVLDGYTYKNPPRVQPGELNMSIGDGKLVWSDSVDIYVYTIATGKTEKITESSPEGSYKVMPKVEAGVVVWQEYKLGGALGAIQPKTLLASLLNPTAYAASGNAVVAYRLSSSSLIGRYATNSDGTSINSGIFGDTLYYDDTTATGYKSIYYVNLANATTLTALPNTGIATVVYLVVLSSVGYFLLRSKSIYNKLSKALIRK